MIRTVSKNILRTLKFEIDFKKLDTYDVVVDKVCSVFDLSSESAYHVATLFTCHGKEICKDATVQFSVP